MPQKPWKQWLAIWVCWTAVALLFLAQGYLLYSSIKERNPSFTFSWYDSFVSQFTYCYTWVLGTKVIFWLGRTFPFERTRMARNILFHVIAGFLLSGAVHGVHSLTVTRMMEDFTWSREMYFILVNCHLGILIYWVILLLHQTWQYSQQYYAEKLQASQLQAQLAQAQLDALKMQLNPHFLFNTLNSISTLLLFDAKTAHTMVARLGDFLRLTLKNSGTNLVSLQQELEFLKYYLEIERTRFQDRLTIEYDLDPRALGCQVPNLFLQPIVENALKHAIGVSSNAGCIVISAAVRDDRLVVSVLDDGPGLPGPAEHPTHPAEGIGLSNTRSRLQHLYGTRYRFELRNLTPHGLQVTFELPVEPEEPQSRVQGSGFRVPGGSTPSVSAGFSTPSLTVGVQPPTLNPEP